jgi:hypothetical protein
MMGLQVPSSHLFGILVYGRSFGKSKAIYRPMPQRQPGVFPSKLPRLPCEAKLYAVKLGLSRKPLAQRMILNRAG